MIASSTLRLCWSSYLCATGMACLLSAVGGFSSSVMAASPVDPSFVVTGLPNTPLRGYVTDGIVNAVQRAGDVIYIGGQFSRVGPRTGPGVEVALDGSRNLAMPEIAGVGVSYSGGAANGLRSVISDGAGGWYIGGLFSHVGGLPRGNVAHILADGSVDPDFQPALNGAVSSLALSGTTLYMAGSFTVIDGTPRSNIAAYHTAFGYTLSFDPYADAQVNAIAVSADGQTVYAGGAFATIGGQARAGLAALKADDGKVTATFDTALSGPFGVQVSSLLLAGTTLYVGGRFGAVNSVPRSALAAVNVGGANDGSLVSAFDATPSYFGSSDFASFDALAISGSVLYAAGSFDTAGGQARSNLVGLDVADGSATDFDPSPQQNLTALAVSGNTIYVGGGFSSIGGQPRHYIAALDATNGSATAFNPNPNNSVSAIAVTADAVYFGGLFSSLGGVSRSGLAAINAGDGTANAWNPAPAGTDGGAAVIKALQVAGSSVYVGGSFTNVGGQPRTNIAALSPGSGIASAWNPSADRDVEVIAVLGNLVYLGGSFDNVGGQPRSQLAAVNTGDGLATSWNPTPDSSVKAIVASDSTIFVGGQFGQIAGAPRSAIAAFDRSSGSLTDWNAELGGGIFGTYVYALALSGSTLYAGGGYTSVRGTSRHNLAGIDVASAQPTVFDAEAGSGSNDGAITALAVDAGTLYVGGGFSMIGGQSRNLLAALNTADGSANSFNPDVAGGTSIQSLSFASGSLYVGGSFPTFARAAAQGYAAFANDVIYSNGFEAR